MKIQPKLKIKMMILISFLGAVFYADVAVAKKKALRQVQEINFSETSLKGTVRNPDGAFLVQKRGIKFMPLFDLQKDMDKKIRNSVDYVR